MTTNVTLLLEQVVGGDSDAANQLFSVVYAELKQLAAKHMKNEAQQHTLQSTALVHEVWLKLIGSRDDPNWKNRKHFFAACAQAMRRILVDSAKTRKRVKRGGDNQKFELQEQDLIDRHDEELLALDEALELLRKEDPQKAELVCLRYFGGFTNQQAAEQLGISPSTADRHWSFAKAWLRAKIDS